jgi:hypothetical protein
MEMQYVSCEVGTEFWNVIYIEYRIQPFAVKPINYFSK